MSTRKIDFKKKYFVLSHPRLIDFSQVQNIIFTTDTSRTVNKISRPVAGKIRQLHFTGDIPDVLKTDPVENQLIKVFPRSKQEIIKYLKPLKERGVAISPAYRVRTLEDVSLATSMGLVVDLIDIMDTLDHSLTLELLDYYLHNTSLDVPIEPFHTILGAKLNHSNQTLWNMNMMNPDQFYHGDETGLAESPDDLSTNQYQYLIDYRTKTFKPTGHPSSILSYFASLPESHPECLACNHFHICIAWALYEKNSCEKWKACLDILQEASRELQALEKFDQEHGVTDPDDR